MSRLLSANLGRLKKDTVFKVALLFTILYAVITIAAGWRSMDINDTQIPIDALFLNSFGVSGFVAVPGIVMAAFCSMFIGTEFSDGTLRNKLIVGHRRKDIYLSNFLTCVFCGISFNLVYLVATALIGIPLFGGLQSETGTLLLLMADGLLAIIAYAAVFNMLAMVLQNKTVCVCLALIIVMASMFLCFYLMKRLEGPPMVEVYQMVDGQTSTETVPNKQYIAGSARKIFQFIIDFLPSGQCLQLSGQSALHLKLMPLYSAVIIFVTNAFGMFLFSRKDIR
ncbi:Uncharacterized protein conserved in bacteria [uncultured Eubacterium sp.]|nr:Uncharacterized protein conserved in bacteria [uncultured Eubacterium sp.]